jgi:hypothetical protein
MASLEQTGQFGIGSRAVVGREEGVWNIIGRQHMIYASVL